MSVGRRRLLRFAAPGIAVVAIAGVVVAIAASHSGSTARTTTTTSSSVAAGPPPTWVPPAGIASLATAPFVADVDGNVAFVGAGGAVQPLLQQVHRYALVLGSTGSEFLIGTRPWEAMISTSAAARFGDVLPVGVSLIPDALGRWWSDFGQVGGNRPLRHLTFPAGEQPVAKLRDGYVVVDRAHTALLVVPTTGSARAIARGNARVLAVANDLVAWSDTTGSVVHIVNVATRATTDVDSGGYAVTARFSPDATRLAVLTLAGGESTVLADTASGRVVTTVATSTSNPSLPQFRAAPPALQPSPFSWDPTSHDLIVVTTSATNSSAVAVYGPDGKMVRTAPAPTGLSQLVVLAGGSTTPATTPAAGVGLVQGQLRGATKGGIVLASGAGGQRFSTSAAADGRFTFRLPPGRYTISGRSFPLYNDGRIDCTAAGPVTVRPNATTVAELTCAAR